MSVMNFWKVDIIAEVRGVPHYIALAIVATYYIYIAIPIPVIATYFSYSYCSYLATMVNYCRLCMQLCTIATAKASYIAV